MKKLLLLLSAFALVAGLSQCRKPNMPVLNAGETQHVVLNASWDNGGSKLEQVGANLKWKVGDSLMVSGGAEGKLYCSFPDGTFEGNIKKISEDKITFTFKSKYYSEGLKEQSGKLNDAVMLSGESEHIASGKYNVSMTMPHAVLLLNLSALGTAGGDEVTINANNTEVASVVSVKNDETSKALYVAVPAPNSFGTSPEDLESWKYEFESSVGSAICNGWELETNKFYTSLDDGGHPTGNAIVITPTSPTPPNP